MATRIRKNKKQGKCKRVLVLLKPQLGPVAYPNTLNTYTKDGMFCVTVKVKRTKTRQVLVHLKPQSEPTVYADVFNAYTKDGMFCVMINFNHTEKFPLGNIWRVTEFDGVHQTEKFPLGDVEKVTELGNVDYKN